MNRAFLKIASPLLAAALLLQTAGCSFLSDMSATRPEESEQMVTGETTGELIQDTYKADHIFSLNRVVGDSFNPHVASTAWNQTVGMLAYETLVSINNSFEAEPNLITAWESEDGRVWKFTVDTSRKFHDGGVMTPYDAIYSIECGRSVYTGKYVARFRHITDMYVLDGTSFVIELDQPNWRFYQLLNIPCIENGSYYSDTPPGTGPYKFNTTGTRLVLDRNHPYASQMPLKTIFLKRYTAAEDILQAFEDSLLDLVINSPADMSSLGYSRSNLIKYVETTNLHYVGFNMRSQIFAYAPYRQMITYAIDRDTIVANALQGAGVAAELPIHPNSALYPKNVAKGMEFSADALQTVVENLGGTDLDADGVVEFGGMKGELVFLVCRDSGAKVSAARQIAAQLRSVGFSVTMSELSYNDYEEALRNGEYDMYYAEVKLCNDWDLTQLLSPGGDLNFGNYQDTAVTGYIQTFMASDREAAPVNAEALCSYLAQNAPITAVCFERTQVLYHRGVLTTINPTQDNIFNDMQDWKVNLE